ncbi:carcinoembryonic antigen-related cell adhesion molecule 1-like [Peromyscus californicus insignis]|uniref:carcinoembryonic antigen-related cell adhesion molecule 1-like n=1 Tax=Peromyscus californicus insignis TaxID=564181 RepID=UPI0022A7618E|nr:carcinoembryonic antigen-related cell adhesion molecule 1-like [Peromyscus californicus insignis]
MGLNIISLHGTANQNGTSLLTYWTSPTTSCSNQYSVIEIVPPYIGEGDDVFLHARNLSPGTFAWHRNRDLFTHEPQYIGYSSSDGEVHFPGERYTGKQKLYNNGSLFIKNVTLNDDGPYNVYDSNGRCAYVNLRIYHGPDVPIIFPSNIHFHSRTNLSLSCHTDANPLPQYSRFVNGELQSFSQKHFIPNINTNNSGSSICLVYNYFPGVNRTTVKNITVLSRIPELSIRVTNTTVKELNSVFLTCIINDMDDWNMSLFWIHDVSSTHWLFNGQRLGLTNRMELSDKNRTLSIDPVRRENSGEYQCEVSNPVSSKRSDPIRVDIIPLATILKTGIHTSVRVTLQVCLSSLLASPTTAHVTVEAVPPHVAEGKNVLLLVHNLPATVEAFYWHKGETVHDRNEIAGFLMPSNTNETGPAYSGRETIYPNGSLLFQNVTQNDAGTYMLNMIMENYDYESASVQFHVHQPVTLPFIRVTNTKVIELDSVFLSCSSNDMGIYISWFFDDISIQWLFNGQSLGLTKRMKLSQNNSTLHIDPVRREDSGKYQCELSNPISSKRSDPIKLDIRSRKLAQVNIEAVPPHVTEGKNVLLLVHNLPGKRACLEVLAGERSYSYTLDRRPVLLYSGKVVLFDRARSFGRDAHGAVREEGDTRLASQISRINPGDQWGDRCRSQIALTSSSF